MSTAWHQHFRPAVDWSSNFPEGFRLVVSNDVCLGNSSGSRDSKTSSLEFAFWETLDNGCRYRVQVERNWSNFKNLKNQLTSVHQLHQLPIINMSNPDFSGIPMAPTISARQNDHEMHPIKWFVHAVGFPVGEALKSDKTPVQAESLPNASRHLKVELDSASREGDSLLILKILVYVSGQPRE